MGLFDVKESYNAKKAKDNSEAEAFETELRELKAKRSRAIMQLGTMVYEANKSIDMSNTEYGELYTAIFEADKDMILLEKRKLASVGLRMCSECGVELPITSVFCNKCGAKQEELEPAVVRASHVCPKCGEPLEKGDMFCTACGYKL